MRVLIVDDSKPVRSILAKMLRGLDYQVVEASNGQEALRQLRQLDSLGQLDGLNLVTVNWQMPVMDGLQLIREIRSDRRLRHLPLVLISAETDRARVAVALAAGASDYLVKPCSESTLVECLRGLGLPTSGVKIGPAASGSTEPPTASSSHPPASHPPASQPLASQPLDVAAGFAPPIRVLIVDDSAVVRRVLGRLLAEDGELRVVGAATDGHDALRLLGQLSADVVLLDIEMPGLDGLETLKIIRQRYPKLPVIMFSSLTERGAKATLDALFLGANDYVPKPGGPEMADPKAGRQVILQQLVPRIKQFRRSAPHATATGAALRTDQSSSPSSAATSKAAETADRQRRSTGEFDRPLERIEIVALATSTGGPAALGQLLPQLRPNILVPIVIVQHMPPLFTRYLAERLASDTKLDVREAADGELLGPSQIRIAPGGRHLTVRRRDGQAVLKLTDDPPENACRPSADVLLRSVAASFGSAALAVVLTGMGKDGLLGCSSVCRAGGQVLVQDEASSVVWGMPGQVARAGLADAVLPLGALAAEIGRRMRRGRRDNSG